jgi:hypothetical protein
MRWAREPYSAATLKETFVDHDTVVLVVELAALAIAIAIGVWRFNFVHRRSNAAKLSQRPAARAYDMRREGQRLSME